MKARSLFALFVLLVLAAGGVFLDTRVIPSPNHAMEKTIPNDRLLK